jgi:glyoxylase-like metal-dependent hydrolase (beta-lactamase superfamily II)
MDPEIIKAGDESGNRMVVRYTSPDGVVVHGIGVPQAWQSSLGPTWSYVVEGDKLTLVDTGCNGSLGELEEGLEIVGYPLSAVGRVVVTHGHLDHDGNCFDVISRSGAELWAHEVYASLLGVSHSDRQSDWRERFIGLPRVDDPEFDQRLRQHTELGQKLTLTNPVTDGDVANGFTFYHTPGHSPDELCIQYNHLLFSGDHILPQITPHPSVNMSYTRFRDILPEDYRSENLYYGLKIFINSLRRVSSLGEDITVMPAHRAYHRGRFNPIGLDRAGVIIEHHRDRCAEIIDMVRKETMDLPAITQRLFPQLSLSDRIFYAAFSEVMSHVELLTEMGDFSLVGDGGRWVQSNGTENFQAFFDQ